VYEPQAARSPTALTVAVAVARMRVKLWAGCPLVVTADPFEKLDY
jgi:hypothetical protein